MLVLSRQRDETIMIGDEIEITIVDIRGDKVRLGINAPRAVSVHRKEVYEAIRRENAEAARVQLDDFTAVTRNLRRPAGAAPGMNGGPRLAGLSGASRAHAPAPHATHAAHAAGPGAPCPRARAL